MSTLSAASPKDAAEINQVERVLSRLLMVGSYGGALLTLAGMALGGLHGAQPSGIPSLAGIVLAALRGSPAGVMDLGVLVVMVTPIARVVGAVIAFAWERDLHYAAVSLGVLLFLSIGLLLGKAG